MAESIFQERCNVLSLFGVGAFLLAVSDCTKGQSFYFPDDGERVTVSVKTQEDLELRSMDAVYRSSICTITNYTAAWVSYEVEGYNYISKQAEPGAEKDVYKTEFDIDGGGECKWKLSRLNFGVQYKYPERLAMNPLVVGDGDVTVLFEYDELPGDEQSASILGDFGIKEDYYLWVADRPERIPKMKVGLFAEEGTPHTYSVKGARSIYFQPRLHSDYVVYSSSVKAKGKGYDVVFTYPDGRVIEDGRVRPAFKRLGCIRLRSQCED